MFKEFSDLTKTIDTVPSDPVYIGEQKVEEVKIFRTIYDDEYYSRKEIKDLNNLDIGKTDKIEWIEVIGLHDEELIEELGRILGLHPLTTEDVLNMSQGAKLEEFSNYIFLNTKNIILTDEGLETEQISFVLKPRLLISFKENKSDVFSNFSRRLKEGSSVRKYGADILLYSLLDNIVDDYFLTIGRVSEDIDDVEDTLLDEPDKELLQDIYELKRDLVFMRKLLWSMRSVVGNLSKNDYGYIEVKTVYYLRDVYDHIMQMIDIVETYRDICSGMLDIYLSSISNKTNDVMMLLTVFSTISVPLTFLTGVYGMNFIYQPELNWKYSYFIFWVISILIVGFMIKYFKDKEWI